MQKYTDFCINITIYVLLYIPAHRPICTVFTVVSNYLSMSQLTGHAGEGEGRMVAAAGRSVEPQVLPSAAAGTAGRSLQLGLHGSREIR